LVYGLHLRFTGEGRILLEPDNRVHDFVWESGSAQNLRDQSIGIKRDWSDKPVELIRHKTRVLIRLGCCGRRDLRTGLCACFYRNRRQGQKETH
jgi:hypothetical protein